MYVSRGVTFLNTRLDQAMTPHWQQTLIKTHDDPVIGWTNPMAPRLFSLHITDVIQCALGKSQSIFSSNSRKTPIARPLGRGMVVFHEFLVWPKFYNRNYCAVCSVLLYCIPIYRKRIVYLLYSVSIFWLEISANQLESDVVFRQFGIW